MSCCPKEITYLRCSFLDCREAADTPRPEATGTSACRDGRHTALLRLRSAAVLPSVRSRSGIAEAGRTHGLRMGTCSFALSLLV